MFSLFWIIRFVVLTVIAYTLISTLCDKLLYTYIPDESFFDEAFQDFNPKVRDKIKYAVYGGSYNRSKIIGNLDDVDGIERQMMFHAKVCVEFLHSASLVADDIIDRESYRRGRVAYYRVFGIESATEMYLILVSLSMDNFKSFIELADRSVKVTKPENISELYYDVVKNLAKSENMRGLCLRYKTGGLFALSFALRAVIENSGKLREAIETGYIYGELYQLIDDIEDYDSDISNGRLNTLSYIEDPRQFVESRLRKMLQLGVAKMEEVEKIRKRYNAEVRKVNGTEKNGNGIVIGFFGFEKVSQTVY